VTQFFPTSETKFYVQNIRQELIASNDPHLITLGLIMSDLQLFLLCQSMEPDGDQAKTCAQPWNVTRNWPPICKPLKTWA